jgi:tetratricopeptide (TPR) repeat protein
MPGESEYDELVMTLLETALQRPSGEREEYLRSVCGSNPALYEEVRNRIEWEDRMGPFLREPLVVPRETSHQVFELGERLGGRFRILREVGHGGMGVVYEAFDEKLDRRIALKCARLGFGSRLPPEARAAREVSHFNVCKLHDLHTAQTPFGDVDFLTMEFVEGETLADRVKRTGPLPEKEAREIALEVCGGLAQAHRQGVVHGDLKCSNIILSRTFEGQPRAVLTDFGLAKLQLADGGVHVMSVQGGTLEYMTPELFLGERASAASDLYALGVLFHIMLTGRAPVRRKAPPAPQPPAAGADVSTVTLGRRVPEEEWERKIEDLPAPWNRVVAQCLSARPAQRPGSAEEVIAALAPKRRTASQWILALALALLAYAAVVFWQSRQKLGPPVRLAVLPMVVEGTPLQAVDGIAQDVADRLSAVRGNFLVIPPVEARSNGVDSPAKAKTVLGATHVLRTRLAGTGGQITALASVIDTASGQTLSDLNSVYAVSDAPVMAKALAATVTRAFHLRSGVVAEVVSPAAYPDYVQGLALIRGTDVNAGDKAIPFFKKAIELDPRSALAYAGLAEAELWNFDKDGDRKWLDSAGEMIAKARSLNPDSAHVLVVAGWFKRDHGQYEQAIEDLRRATEVEPSNSEAWSRLARVNEAMNRPQDAEATYRKAIAAQPGYYRPYYEFGVFYHLRGQYREAEVLFRQVTALAPEFDDGYTHLGLALMHQERYSEAEEAMRRSLRLHESARVLTDLGVLYYRQERYAEAVPFYEKSVVVGPASAVRYVDLGDGYWRLGRSREAAEAYRAARKMAEDELTRNPRKGSTRALLGWIYARLGDPGRAVFETTQALGLEPDNPKVIQAAAEAYEILGQRDKALSALTNAPVRLLEELSRKPDTKELGRDPRLVELINKKSMQ